MDERFAARVARINSGRQWEPDGALGARGIKGRRRRLPFFARPNVRFTLLTLVAIGIASAAVDPETLPAPVQGLMDTERLATLADVTGLRRLIATIPGL